ncbi:bifunctional UDP-sugar hydrolase/5'-nucleotidase [Vibrio mediterranei]|uniref:bifunctional metallophosphatase/5'-nucleotidase n=1 Tax=Vibrio mediterranei TaxID=689 RepID=UPI0038CE370A
MKKNNKPLKLTIAHINDTHSYFEPTSLPLTIVHNETVYQPFVSAGGFARIATRVEQLRAQADDEAFLLLHAGDCFQGTLYFSLFKGEANAELLNELRPDAMALGNHELDMGNEPVGKFIREIEFPLLAGNWNLSREGDKEFPLNGHPNLYQYDAEQKTAQWIVKSVGNEQVAIFGLSIDKMADIANPDCDTSFESSLEVARATIAAIKQSGINKIIILSHMGYETDLEIAGQLEGVGLIIGGHSHVLQGDFSQLGLASKDHYGVNVNGTYVVQAGYHAMMMGHCEIEFDSDGSVVSFYGKNELLVGRRVFMDVDGEVSSIPYEAIRDRVQSHPNVQVCRKHPSIKQIMNDKYRPRVKALQEQKVTTLNHTLRHIRLPDEQGGSEIAPLVAASFLHTMKALGHQVDFAIHNAGGVRNSLNRGAISVADIAGKLLPFAVPIGIYKIKGKFIPRIIEGAIDNAIGNGVVGTGSGSYPYTSQLEFHYDKDKPKGARVTDIKIANQSIELNKIYTGSSSAYTMKGKEGYDAILNMEGTGTVTNWSMADCFIKLLSDRPYVVNRVNRENKDSVPK